MIGKIETNNPPSNPSPSPFRCPFGDVAQPMADPNTTSRQKANNTPCHIAPAADPLKNGLARTSPNNTTASTRSANNKISRMCRILRLRSRASRRKSIAAQLTVRNRRRLSR